MNRRRFLKTGLIGGAVLAAGGAWVVWREMHDADRGSLTRDRIAEILGAIAPVLLAGALPTEPAQRSKALADMTKVVKAVIAVFPPAVASEVSDLFRLLDVRIARRLLTGVSASWRDVDPVDVKTFLERWRWSRIALLQTGYFALHDLILGAWYANESAWAAMRYPGPPNIE